MSVKNYKNRINELTAQREHAQAVEAKAQLDYNRTKIYAPFNGRITAVHVARGDRVNIGDPLIDLFNKEKITVRTQIPTNYLEKIHSKNQHKVISLSAYATVDGKSIKLELNHLAGEIAQGRGGNDAIFDIVSGGGHLALGRSIKLTVILPKLTNVYSIPAQALYGRDRIYKIVNNRLQAISIKILGEIRMPDDTKRLIVTSAELQSDEKIMTTHIPNAITGLKVNILKQ